VLLVPTIAVVINMFYAYVVHQIPITAQNPGNYAAIKSMPAVDISAMVVLTCGNCVPVALFVALPWSICILIKLIHTSKTMSTLVVVYHIATTLLPVIAIVIAYLLFYYYGVMS